MVSFWSIALIINVLPIRGAYDDYKTQYQLISTDKSYADATTHCQGIGKELADLTSEAERVILANISTAWFTWLGVRCKTAGVAHDWSYLGTNYL